MAPIEKADLLQGTLDLLILKIVALGPVHALKNSLPPPKVAAPKLNTETLRPEPPRSLYSMAFGLMKAPGRCIQFLVQLRSKAGSWGI